LTETVLTGTPSAAEAPALTLPEAEAAQVAAAFAAAQTILEYGSGGSTVLAAGLPGRAVFSVESDRNWLSGLEAWFEANPPQAKLYLHHADIGPTGKWGVPTDETFRDRFPAYALSVWDRPDFVQPDVVLIDGRFRVGCFLATLFRSSRPVTVLWDDYAGRPVYHVVERYLRPVEMHGRMARFDVTPMPVPPADLGWIMGQFGLVK
jgi:hypothetical protein